MRSRRTSGLSGPAEVKLAKVEGPLGIIWIASSEKGLCGIHLRDDIEELKGKLSKRRECWFRVEPEGNKEAIGQITEYFEGRRKTFELQLDLWGSQFEILVWKSLVRVPYGRTRSYGEIASDLGMPRAARAVGGAASRNLVPIVVPCHRLIRGDGTLGGFSSGLEMKQRLLELERKFQGF